MNFMIILMWALTHFGHFNLPGKTGLHSTPESRKSSPNTLQHVGFDIVIDTDDTHFKPIQF